MAIESNRYKHPGSGLLSRILSCVANSQTIARIRRATIGKLPFIQLESDVRDVIYATWLVESERVQSFLPAGASLWQHEGLTPFTILTYRHGHFGPRFTGPFRRLFPSPLQSNWRLYLDRPLPSTPEMPTVAFVKNILNNTLYGLGTRLFSDVLPSHVPLRFKLDLQDLRAAITIEPGTGSAPQLSLEFDRDANAELPMHFDNFASSWGEAVERLTFQDAAVMPVSEINRVAYSTISLPIDLSSIEPLTLNEETARCPFMSELGVKGEALCFRLPKVKFTALSEKLL